MENAMGSPETRLKELQIVLPTPAKPVAKYKPAVLVGNMLYVSGHGPAKVGNQAPLLGKVGSKLNLEQGMESARLVGINILSTLLTTPGSPERVKRLVKKIGSVHSARESLD